jgi:large subunit ribosomal protein L10
LGEKAIKEKELIVSDLTEKFQKAQSIVLYDYIGLTVAEVSNLRNQFRKAGVEYKVIKNTLLKRTADGLGLSGLGDYLKGPTAVAFSYADPVVPAKILVDFIKQVKKTEIKSGVLAGRVIDSEGVKSLASLPSKEELLARMLGSMNAPVTGFVMVLSGVLRKFVYAVNAIKESKQA